MVLPSMFSLKSLRFQVKTILALASFGALALLVFLFRWLGGMSANGLYQINASCQFALIIMGAVVVIRPKWPERHPWLILGSFALVGALGMFAGWKQQQVSARETAEAQKQLADSNAKLSSSLDRLGAQSNEIARVQELNTALQQKLLDSSGKLLDQSTVISGLSKEAIETTTGGDSFCYMSLTGDPDSKIMTPIFLHYGKHPLYGIHARIVNPQLLNPLQEAIRKEGRSPTVHELFSTDVDIEIGDLSLKSSWVQFGKFIPFDTTKSGRQDFNVFFNARNGYWSQTLRWRKVSDKWTQATRVSKDDGGKQRVVFTKIDPKFPRQELDW